MGRKSLKQFRQKEIISAFYEVAKIEGLENASIAKVAKKMGVNPSLIIHYFNSKEEMIFGLISYILDSYKYIYSANTEASDSRKELIQVIENLFSREWNELFDDSVFYSSFSLVFRNDHIKNSFRELHVHLRNLLTKVIEKAKEDGHVQVDCPKNVSDLIFVMVEGAYYYLSLYDNDETYQKKLTLYKDSAYQFLNLTIPVKAS